MRAYFGVNRKDHDHPEGPGRRASDRLPSGERGLAVAALAELAAHSDMDFSLAMARAQLDDAVREERLLHARRGRGR